MSFPIEKYKTQTQLETTKIQNSFLYPHLIKAYELKKAKPHINKAQIKRTSNKFTAVFLATVYFAYKVHVAYSDLKEPEPVASDIESIQQQVNQEKSTK